MGRKAISRIIVFLLFAVLVCSRPSMARASGAKPVPELTPGLGSTVAITLSYVDDKGKTVTLSGINVTLYQVADLGVNNGAAYYTLTDQFKPQDMDFNTMTAEKSKEYASTLAAFAAKNKIKGEAKSTDQQGKVAFEEAKPGIYLATMEQKTENGKTATYKMSPFLIMAPTPMVNEKDFKWEYVVTIIPKFQVNQPTVPTTTPNTPTATPTKVVTNPIPGHSGTVSQSGFYSTPKTGDDTHAGLWWGIFGASLLGVALLSIPRPKRHNEDE